MNSLHDYVASVMVPIFGGGGSSGASAGEQTGPVIVAPATCALCGADCDCKEGA